MFYRKRKGKSTQWEIGFMQVFRLRGIMLVVSDQSLTKEISRNSPHISRDKQFPIEISFIGGDKMKLKDCHEFVGTLESYTQEKDCVKLVFMIRKTMDTGLLSMVKQGKGLFGSSMRQSPSTTG